MARFIAFVFAFAWLGPVSAATFDVTNLNDSGGGSLRDAIAQANANPGLDTITFSVTGTILLTSGQIQISGPTTIVGPGAGNLTIDANAHSRVFSIFVTDLACPALDGLDYLVSISGLRLTNALRTQDNGAGAIFTEHSIALDSVIIDNSVAARGGGLFFLVQYPGQALTIKNARFLDNIAKPTAGQTVNNVGGALVISEKCGTRTTPVTVAISSSLFSGNHAQPTGQSGQGGAIGSLAYADFTITDTRISGNTVDVPNPPVANQQYRGGAFYGTFRSFVMQGSEVSDNVIDDTTGSDLVRAGGLGFLNNFTDLQGPGSASTVQLVNSTVSGNVSSAASGAMIVIGNVAVELDNSTIANNLAAAGRSGGIGISNGSGGTLATPTLDLVSTILSNTANGNLDVGLASTIPAFTLNATTSLIGSVDAGVTISGSGTLTATNPQLGPLAFNGGAGRTHALMPASPAINAGSNPLSLPTDQRGVTFPRTALGGTDMGAYEVSLTPLAGDWDGNGTDTIGLHFPTSGLFALNNANAPGPASLFFGYGPVDPSWIALSGDWDGNGTRTPGLYDPATGNFFLRNSSDPGPADLVFGYGPGGNGLVPLSGDWNGDGVDTIGLYDPNTGGFFLRNSNSAGAADVVFSFGVGGPGLVPVVGDWDGDGTTTPGLYDTQTSTFFLRNSNSPGPADLAFSFGAPSASYVPIVGNWDGAGGQTIALYDRSTGVFFLRNSNSAGAADLVFGFGPGGP